MSENMTYYQRPVLRRPNLVVAFHGWPDAAQVGTGALAYLCTRLKAQKFAEILPEEFYGFAVARPIATIEGGLVKEAKFPTSEFYYWQGDDQDLILFIGTEPHLKWKSYADLMLGLAQEMGVTRIIALGGLYDRSPHTREPRVTGLTNQEGLKGILEDLEVNFSDYQGPSSFHATLLLACGQRGLEGISLWGHAPFYVRAVVNPKACHVLLQRLCRLLRLDLDLEDVRQAGEYLNDSLNQLVKQSSELQRLVQELEEEYETASEAQRLQPLEGVDHIIQEVENFLRKEKQGGEGE